MSYKITYKAYDGDVISDTLIKAGYVLHGKYENTLLYKRDSIKDGDGEQLVHMILVNNDDKTISKEFGKINNGWYPYHFKKFTNDELELFYKNGYKLLEEHAKQMNQTIESWF